MRKILLFLLLLSAASAGKAQTTCATAINFDSTSIDGTPKQLQSIQSTWYKFTSLNTTANINIRFLKGYDNIDKVILWSGACGSPTKLTQDTISGSTDSLLALATASLSTSNIYFLQVIKTNATDTSYYQVDINFLFTAPTCASCSLPAVSCDLICNGDFEAHTGIPSGQNQILLACPWVKANSNTPDHLYVGGTGGMGIPGNTFGTQASFTSGQLGYAGIVARSGVDATHSGNEKEFFYQRMKSAMITGRTYTVQMRVSLSDYSRYAANGLGMYFSAGDPYSAGITSIPYVSAQTVTTGSTYVTNTSSWLLLSWTYTSVANEAYVTIGCFGGVNNNITPAITPPSTFAGYYSYYYIDDISVKEIVSATANASPASICPGGSTSLAAGPTGTGYTYSWSPSTGLSSTSVYNPTANPSSTTTYTVTVTSASGCSATASTTVTVNPIPSINSGSVPNPGTVCAGTVIAASSFTSTPGGATYTWINSNTGIGLTASGSGNVPSFPAANPGTTAITATITATPALAGCTGTPSSYTITVNPNCSSAATVISTAAGNTSYSSGTPSINAATVTVLDDITVSGTAYLTISSPDVRFAANKKITVLSGATLKVDGAWLHACSTCGSIMWDGIYVEKGATLIITKASLIEDALNAVVTKTTGSGTIPNYNIFQAVFNKNATAIKIQANSNDMSSNVIKNIIVTCRVLPAPTSTSFVTDFNNLKTALSTNSLSSYATTTTNAGVRSAIGVEMISLTHNSSYPKIGAAAGGSTDMSYFDNLDYGVKLTDSRCDIKNCSFKNLTGNQLSGCHGCATPDPTGIGVWAPVQTSQLYTDLIVGGTGTSEGNIFYDCYRGMEINNYFSVNGIYNTMTCSVTPNPFPSTGNTKGAIAIYLKDIKEIIRINGTSSTPITNWATGIWFTRNTVSTGTLNPQFDIDGNTISANSSGYCNQAILVADVATSITTTTPIYVRNNTIYDVKNGIKASNIKNNLVIYNNPGIGLRYTSGTTVCSGIFLESCDKTEIKNNSIYSLRGTYGSADNWEMRGIYVKTSTDNTIFCNTLSSLGECLVFEGGCSSLTSSGYGVMANDMDNARSGFMLRSSGVVGTQGSSTVPNSNHWFNFGGLNFTNGQTYVSSSAPASSLLYCLGTPPSSSFPSINSGTPAYSTSGVATLISASGTELDCSTISVPSGLASAGTGYERSYRSGTGDVAELKALLAGSLLAETFVPADWMMQNYIFNRVKASAALQEDSTLNAFYLDNQTTAFGILNAVNDEIGALNYSQAALLNNSFSPANVIEQNQQAFNAVYLAHRDSLAAYSSTEVDQLYAIAGECGIIGGDAVYQSRNLLMSIENRLIEFGDSCDLENNISYERSQSINENARLMKLYPNPGNGKITLECGLESNESALLRIYDLSGKPAGSYTIDPGTKTFYIDAGMLQPGMYQYEIIVNGKTAQRNKLVIMK